MAVKKNPKLPKSKWSITTNRFVGFIDIMGFKDLVSRSSHQEIYTMMKEIDKAKKLNESVPWGGNSEMVRSTFYSDSIILYSKDESANSANSISATLSSLTNDLLVSGIPHKGALAFGPMTLDEKNSIFFGQPLIDAYLLQEELIVYGIVIHSSAEHQFELLKFTTSLTPDYLCPFKGGVAKHLMIPPIYAGNVEDDYEKEEQRRLTKGIRILRHKTSGHLRKYIDNTESYLDNIH